MGDRAHDRGRFPAPGSYRKVTGMARMMIDCRDVPSESNCTLAIAGDDIDDLLDAAVLHARSKHGHEDGPALREGIRGGLKPVDPAMA